MKRRSFLKGLAGTLVSAAAAPVVAKVAAPVEEVVRFKCTERMLPTYVDPGFVDTLIAGGRGIITTGQHPKALWPGVNKLFREAYEDFPEPIPALFDTNTSSKG